MTFLLPSVLTTKQFAFLTQYNEAVIRRKISKERSIKAHGNPYRIPRRELLKFGVTLDDAAVLLGQLKEQTT